MLLYEKENERWKVRTGGTRYWRRIPESMMTMVIRDNAKERFKLLIKCLGTRNLRKTKLRIRQYLISLLKS